MAETGRPNGLANWALHNHSSNSFYFQVKNMKRKILKGATIPLKKQKKQPPKGGHPSLCVCAAICTCTVLITNFTTDSRLIGETRHLTYWNVKNAQGSIENLMGYFRKAPFGYWNYIVLHYGMCNCEKERNN